MVVQVEVEDFRVAGEVEVHPVAWVELVQYHPPQVALLEVLDAVVVELLQEMRYLRLVGQEEMDTVLSAS